MLSHFAVAFTGLVVAIGGIAAAPVRLQVPEIKPLLLAAIDAPDGRAAGVLHNADTEAISRRFGATSPVYVDVSTLVRYAQPGCRRLAVRVWQEGVRLGVQQLPGTQSIEFGINYCHDGLPPANVTRESP